MAKLHTELDAQFQGGHVSVTIDCPDVGAMSETDRQFVQQLVSALSEFTQHLAAQRRQEIKT